MGPYRLIVSFRSSPLMYAVASHGTLPSGLASTTGLVKAPPTFLAASTSARNLARNSGSPASSGRTTLMATARPAGDAPR
jgi:hypothetical protein